jgi:hypothetical protein
MDGITAPLLDPAADVIEYEDVLFRGALYHTNIYKGKPSKKMDEAWAVLTHCMAHPFPFSPAGSAANPHH